MFPEVFEPLLPSVLDLRRRLHRIPEPGFAEHQTTAAIFDFLAAHGLQPRIRAEGTGLWVDVGANPKVGYRADIDALPITEPEHNDPRSGNEGWMHACGHDAHAAIAAGVAVALARIRPDAPARILFQPAEESLPGGARRLVAEGVLDGLQAIFAFHVDPTKEPGTIGVREGNITGSADGLTLKLIGPGGHTSRPQRTVNLIEVAGQLVLNLPPAIRASIDPAVQVVTAFGSVHGGDAANVIPTEVTLRGTVRTGDRAVWETLPELVAQHVKQLVEPSGATFELTYVQGVAPVFNDQRIVAIVRQALVDNLGEAAVVTTEPSMGGEDFADYLDVVPGALFRLGTRSDGGDIHSARFRINEEAIGFGLRAGTAMTLSLIDELG